MPNINKIRLSGTTYTVQDENAITQIKTINNQSLIGEGNIDIQGGGSVTVDPSLNSGSTNPVANSAITEAVTASEKNVWIKSNTLYSFFQSITGITYNFAVGSAVVGQRINITFQDGGNEVWEYGYSSWSCSSTSLESPHYTVSQDGKLWVFTQNDDGVTVNSASIESTNTVTQKNLTFILLETTNVIPSETLGQRVGRIERVLKSLDGMAFPFYKRNYSNSSAIGNTAVAQINTQTGEISYSDSGYNLFGLDAKTFGWEQDINSNPNGKLTFTKYLIDKDVLLSTSPNFSIDVSSIEGEGYTNDKSLTSMKVWAIKTNPNYSQSFADLHVSIMDTGNTTSIAEISFMYDENRGLTIEDMMSRTSMSYPNFKFGDTVVADFNGVFPSGNCNIRINNWDGSNCFVSSIDFYGLLTDTSYHSDYVILFDEWMYGIEERFSELDDKEEATAKALYDLKDTKLDASGINEINDAVLITSENRNSIVEHIENDIYELETNDIYSISFIPKDLEYTEFRFQGSINGNYTDVTANKNVDTATTQISITFDSETNRITVTSLDRDANKIDVLNLMFKKTYYEDLEISDVYIIHNPSLGVAKTEYEKTIQTSYKQSGGYITERKGNTEIKYNYETTSTSNLVNGSAVNAAINKVKTRFDGFGQSYKGGNGCTDYASQSPNITDFTSGEHSVTLSNTQSSRVWWFNVKLNENSTDTFGDLSINFSADGVSFGTLSLFLQMNTLMFSVGDLTKRIDVTDKTQTYSVFVPNGILVNTAYHSAVASYNVWTMTEGEPFFLESIGIFSIPQDSSCLESFDEWKSNVDTDISNLSASTRGAVDMVLNHINDSTVHVTSAEKATWNAKSDFSGDYNDLTNKLSAGTNITIVDNVISAEGGGGLTEDDELLLSTALTDLNDRKIDASEVKSSYQKKGDYATKDYVATALEPYETKLDEINTEEVTAYALNDLNNRFGGLSLVKITESEYEALTTKDENTLYIVIADPS